MNQILSFKNTENGKKILKNNTKHLAIFLIIFALVLIASGSWRLYTNLTKKVDVVRPNITGYSRGGKTTFNVKSEIGVKKVIYSWNDGEQSTYEPNGSKDFKFDIENPIGVNELALKIVSVDNTSVTYENIKIVYDVDDGLGDVIDDDMTEEDWERAIANDKNMPTVSLASDKGKVAVTAIDDVKMSYITYSWNGGEEVKVTGLSEDEKTLSARIDAMKGNNTIKIKAYDKAGNVKEVEREIHGTDGPKISVKKDADELIVTVTDEFEITKVEYNFNNEEKTIDNIEGTNYEFRLKLKDGENFIIVNAYEGNVKAEYKGKTTK